MVRRRHDETPRRDVSRGTVTIVVAAFLGEIALATAVVLLLLR